MKKIKFELEQLRKIYKFGSELKLSDFLFLIKSAKLRKFKSNEILLATGSKSTDVFYIRKGLIRIYMIKDNGEEVTVGFRSENQVIANYDSVLFKKPSRMYIQAIEPSTTLSLNYEIIFDLLEKSPKLLKNYHLVYEELLKATITRLESFVLFSPEERYVIFLKNNPNLIKRIQDKYLANYLGMTPVSLSRIKARIKNNINSN